MYLEQIESGAKLYVGIQGVGVSLTSEYIGMIKGECLIIKSPTPYINIKQKLFPGNTMVIKTSYKDSSIIFQTNIIESIKRPRIVILEYPESVQKK
jgi:hypothetical protein